MILLQGIFMGSSMFIFFIVFFLIIGVIFFSKILMKFYRDVIENSENRIESKPYYKDLIPFLVCIFISFIISIVLCILLFLLLCLAFNNIKLNFISPFLD